MLPDPRHLGELFRVGGELRHPRLPPLESLLAQSLPHVVRDLVLDGGVDRDVHLVKRDVRVDEHEACDVTNTRGICGAVRFQVLSATALNCCSYRALGSSSCNFQKTVPRI